MVNLKDFFNSSKYVALFYPNEHSFAFKPSLLAANSLKSIPHFSSEKNTGLLFYNYDYKNQIESLCSENPDHLKFPDHLYFESEQEHPFKNLKDLFTEKFSSDKINVAPTVSKTLYIEKVKALKEHIQRGDIYEINYCIAFEAFDVKINPAELYFKLNKISKAPYSAFVKLNDKFIMSSSPELFLSRRNNNLFTKPVKGTAKRGLTFNEDELIKNELQNSLKERTENVMIVDVARNDFSRIAKKGSVSADKLYEIETYEQVHQMASTVSCELKENTTIDSIINAAFPMASMTGAPKIRAMQLIDEYELYSRGPYSGCLGYLNPNGDFDLNVLIRSIFYDATNKYLSFSVGSAITHLCDPEKEYEECLLKAKAMMEVLGS